MISNSMNRSFFAIKILICFVFFTMGEIMFAQKTLPKPISELVNNQMVYIKGGTFMMGALTTDKDRNEYECPSHKVTLSSFYISAYEITFAQYDSFCEATGKKKSSDNGWGRGNMPAINVSWYDAIDFCRWMSRITGKSFRLPTEAEWEYACRAGTTTPYNTGKDLTLEQANYYPKNIHSGKLEGIPYNKPKPVGSYPPNKWGLYDMHGNLKEFTNDNFSGNFNGYEKSPVKDPKGPDIKTINPKFHKFHMCRGGSWYIPKVSARSSERVAVIGYGPSIGFRIVLNSID